MNRRKKKMKIVRKTLSENGKILSSNDIEVFSIDELADDVKPDVLGKFRETVVDFPWDTDEIECIISELEKFGLIDGTILYSGFWSKGDGACFNNAILDIREWSQTEPTDRYPTIRKYFDEDSYNLYCHVRHSGYYYHENCMDFIFDDILVDEIPLSEWDELKCSVIAWFKDEAKKAYRRLEKTYEAATTDEAVIDFLNANDYLFDNEGHVIHV
jgi:hypothetical protein